MGLKSYMENKKEYKIKIPVFVSEKANYDNNGKIIQTTIDELINSAKTLINEYNSKPTLRLTSDKRNKAITIGIECINYEDIAFNEDKCLLLRAKAYKTNLIDGFYQSGNNLEQEIRFKEDDKICSDTYCFILYPFKVLQSDNGLKFDIYWHIFIYEDPSKMNDEMSTIARLIMRKIIGKPIKNIKSEKLLSDIKKSKVLSEVEINLSTIGDDEEGVPEYLNNYKVECKTKKLKSIKLNNMSSEDAIKAIKDDSFLDKSTRRLLRFKTPNNRVFTITQEFKENLIETLEDSFNYAITIKEEDIKNGNIFKTEIIKQNVEGIFTRYMSACDD